MVESRRARGEYRPDVDKELARSPALVLASVVVVVEDRRALFLPLAETSPMAGKAGKLARNPALVLLSD